MNCNQNVARRLSQMALERPASISIAEPQWRERGTPGYRTLTFAELETDTNRIASGLLAQGIRPGMRVGLLVRPGIDFIASVFALLKVGAVQILIDPGMGKRNLIQCLADARPQALLAIPAAQLVLRLFSSKFPEVRLRVTVGSRFGWGGMTLNRVRSCGTPDFELFNTSGDDPAAIIFTTGSTGPPKGVLYHHRVFERQVIEIGEAYGIRPGEIDLPGFPLFGLFNAAMGVTTVVPQMNPSRPARVNPRRFVDALRAWGVTQSFGSPAIWNRVGKFCEERRILLPSVKRVLSAGAPVPPHVLARMKACLPADAEMHTPYGATEALPVATISASEVLTETSAKSRTGAGTCVGRRFGGIDWKVICIHDGPLPTIDAAKELPRGEIGELVVRGAVVTREYVTRTDANALAKIHDGDQIWHRMGDVGYLDDSDRFWFCGRMAHRVITRQGTMFTIPCEAIFNNHPAIFRSALVGVGPVGSQRPVIIAEPWPGQMPTSRSRRQKLTAELLELGAGNPLTSEIRDVLLHRSMPVDIRHNAKIFREKLAIWAAKRL